MDILVNIGLSFIPVFVAVDALGVLPIYISFTVEMDKKEKHKIIFQSVITAISLAIVFIFLGKWIFNILAISIGDFMIAGGIILFAIALMDLLSSTKRRRIPSKDLGFVPLGTPLIVGPGVLTTSLLLLDQFGIIYTLVSVVLNVILAGLIFLVSGFLHKILGEAGAKALSKMTNLLLAAIAVMMVRKGLLLFL
ncbi:MAG: MarC family protein [Spirochaetales bacterium]|nr:MarC family protein [Spirochaetales bacterium]